MEIAARLPWTDLGDGKLTTEHVQRTLPEALRAPAPGAWLKRSDGAHTTFVDDLLQELDDEARPSWEPVRSAQARVVVTGQQPGCAGGTLLVLYKAATAVAAAQRLARTHGVPVVPVFWNATDDVDFDEIARVGWPDPTGGVGFLELPRTERRSEAFVGSLPAQGDEAAVAAALASLPESRRDTLRAVLPDAARDHGDWVARLLRRVFPEIAVLDARSAVLRRHARPLFERYLDVAPRVAAQVDASGNALEAQGYARALSAASTRTALFLLRDDQRHKIDGDLGPLRQALREEPESLAPNVVLRPLVQDLLLPVVAQVVGPSELHYLLELRAVRRLLEVPEPALVPRLTMTHGDADAWNEARGLGLDVGAVLRDDEAAWRACARGAVTADVDALQSAFTQLDAQLETLEGKPAYASRVGRARRRARSLCEDLVAHFEDVALHELWTRRPGLAALRARTRPRSRPQERVLAALWLLSYGGARSGAHLERTAALHLDALEDGRVEHFVAVD